MRTFIGVLFTAALLGSGVAFGDDDDDDWKRHRPAPNWYGPSWGGYYAPPPYWAPPPNRFPPPVMELRHPGAPYVPPRYGWSKDDWKKEEKNLRERDKDLRERQKEQRKRQEKAFKKWRKMDDD